MADLAQVIIGALIFIGVAILLGWLTIGGILSLNIWAIVAGVIGIGALFFWFKYR